jgi:hypothetical protein
MQPWHIAWTLCVVPILAAHGAYLIAIEAGAVPSCVPYIDGCVSISRAGRNGNALYWFRGLLMPCASLLVLYWWQQKAWLDRLLPNARSKHRWIFATGSTAAVCLLLYANFLGSSGDIYNLMRRFGVTLYFALTALAQLLSLHTQTRAAFDAASRRLTNFQFILVSTQWGMGLIHVATKPLLPPATQDVLENAIEWHFALYITLFFGFSARIWQLQQFRWTFSATAR